MDPVYSESKAEKGLPFLDEEEEEYAKLLRSRKTEDDSKFKPKPSVSARELFEERFGKWDNDYISNKDEDLDEEEDQAMEELYRSRKQAIRKEEKAAKKKDKKKNRASPSPSPSKSSDRSKPLFPVLKDTSPPPRSTKKKEPEFNFSLKTFNEEAQRYFTVPPSV